MLTLFKPANDINKDAAGTRRMSRGEGFLINSHHIITGSYQGYNAPQPQLALILPL